MEKFYITTAINYTNGPGHMGHAYEAIIADIIARYHRIYGRDVFFLTGTDEHGQKIEKASNIEGINPKDYCDKYALLFMKLDEKLNISYNKFIRTTNENHKKTAKKIWEKVKETGDIYLGTYEGWYDINNEQYISDFDAKSTDYKDIYGRPYERKKEESYFLKMEKHRKTLIDHINNNPTFIQPEERKTEILNLLQEPLNDLCISRTTCQWGIPCPIDNDYSGSENHVMYVWFDALTNYLSGIDYINENSKNSKYWPASIHLIGKDIIKFHCIYWPCILLSANIELPKSIFAHGFINDKDGKKMGKSLGNAVDPLDILSKFPTDSFRIYLARETQLGYDISYNEDNLRNIHNSVLVNGIGNLLKRVTNLCKLYFNNTIPTETSHNKYPFNLQKLIQITELDFSIEGQFNIQNTINYICQIIGDINKYITEYEPWKIKNPNDFPLRNSIIRTVLESIYILSHFLEPFIPTGATTIFCVLNTPPKFIQNLSHNFDNLTGGTTLYHISLLYNPICIL